MTFLYFAVVLSRGKGHFYNTQTKEWMLKLHTAHYDTNSLYFKAFNLFGFLLLGNGISFLVLSYA
jgi:hypothetical protein